MKLFPTFLLLALLCAGQLTAQSTRKVAPSKPGRLNPAQSKLAWPGKNTVPVAPNPFNLGNVQYPTLSASAIHRNPSGVRTTLGKNGLPILFEGKTAASVSLTEQNNAGNQALEYLASLQPDGVRNPKAEFQALSVNTDEQGNTHARLQQMWNGVPVFGGEVVAHTRAGVFQMLNGRYFPTPDLVSPVPALDVDQCKSIVYNHFGIDKVKTTWSTLDLTVVGGKAFDAELVVYHPRNRLDGERLSWKVEFHPNLIKRMIYFVDAETGDVLNAIDQTCSFGHHHDAAVGNELPPVTGSGLDLFNTNRTFGAWLQSGSYYLEDTGKSMYNAGQSNMPFDPVGVIMTLDAFNTSPENQNFNYDIVTSASSTFNNKKAVSAHYNASVSYDYYKNTFNRNSINGTGGNILSFINVSESNGASMENAYWNGAAMWYGNGGSTFKELARGLDVAGHEMTHGVVEKTANLVYQDEPGALNESFADIFGAMIDRDDWLIGEDVMQPGASPSGALRSLQDPHNGDVTNGQWWQPRNVSEQYTGNQDNGGVHINSGIPNYAFYLFASNASVGKDKAEQVYYKALRDYLVKSSQFVDCRIAVIQAAQDLYGASVAQVAANAFTSVGIIGDDPGGNYLGELSPNPGTDYVVVVSNDLQNVDLYSGAGASIGTLFDQGVQSRPSITDNGRQIVFVDAAGNIIGIDVTYNGNNIDITTSVVSFEPVWRNAAISKDGRFLAAIAENEEPIIYIVDLNDPLLDGKAFELYNPTSSTGNQVTNDVQYADVLEFDYSGEYLMYDAYNELNNGQTVLGYWDIGFLKYWENGAFTDPADAFISKLFNGLNENISIGNPTFSKNSPFIIAFDYIDDNINQVDILGANIEKGEVGTIVENNGSEGWPAYNRLDNQLVYEGLNAQSVYNIYRRGLASDKINGQGNETLFISNRNWVRWYANGNRSLIVGAGEATANPFELSATPNPAGEQIRVAFHLESAADVQLTLFNPIGQVALSQNMKAAAGDNQFDLNLNGLPAGTYTLRMASGNAVAAMQVLKY